MSNSHLSSLSNLPPEILQQICLFLFANCDENSIIQLSLTCRTVHQPILAFFHQAQGITWNLQVAHSLVVNSRSRQALPSLRVALFIHALDSIQYYFAPDYSDARDCSSLLKDTNDLQRFILRIPPIRSVTLDFSEWDAWYLGNYGKFPRLSINRDQWKRAFIGLIRTLGERCRELRLVGSRYLHQLYPYSPPKTIPEEKNSAGIGPTFWRKIIALAIPSWKKGPDIQPMRTGTSSGNLESLFIHSDMALHDPFPDWLAKFLLSSSSSTLTKLSLHTANQLDTWKSILAPAQPLPKLTDFEIVSSSFAFSSVYSSSIRDFLVLNPSIQILNLRGITLSHHDQKTPPVLPHLTSLTAHPTYLWWIMRSLVLPGGSFDHLSSLTIYLQSNHGHCADDNLFDATLLSIAWLKHKIELGLKFHTPEGVKAWFSARRNSSSIGDHTLGSSALSWIEHLRLELPFMLGLERHPACSESNFNDILDLVPQWVSIFRHTTSFRLVVERSGSAEQDSALDAFMADPERDFVGKLAMGSMKKYIDHKGVDFDLGCMRKKRSEGGYQQPRSNADPVAEASEKTAFPLLSSRPCSAT